MLTDSERIHFKDELQKVPRIMLLSFLLLVFLAIVSIGILLEGILHAQEPLGETRGSTPAGDQRHPCIRPTQRPYLPAPLLKTDVEMILDITCAECRTELIPEAQVILMELLPHASAWMFDP